MSTLPGTMCAAPYAVVASSLPSSRMSRKRRGGAKLRSMYACLKGSISHEKTCSTPMETPVCLRSALQIMSSASSGDSVPEHMVATRSGRPARSRARPAREHPSSAAPLIEV
eukprot:scaffold253161_cov23-Tisochrysis_lutea.AAC.3